MRDPIVIALISLAIAGSGCSKDSNTHSAQAAEVETLKGRVEELEVKVIGLELSNDENKTAFFDTAGNKIYQRVDANVGYFLVVLEDSKPYLDGQKVTLLIGNPNSVTFNGFDIKATWGPRWPDSKLPSAERTKAMKAYLSSQREKQIKLTETLRPGTWNKINLTIAPAKAEEFGRLGIAITTNQVALAGGR